MNDWRTTERVWAVSKLLCEARSRWDKLHKRAGCVALDIGKPGRTMGCCCVALAEDILDAIKPKETP